MAEFLNAYGIYLFGIAALTVVVLAAILKKPAKRTNELEAIYRRIGEISRAMEDRQERLRNTLEERMDDLCEFNDMKFEQLRKEVSGRLDARLGESFRTVNEQLARVDKGLGEMRTMASGVSDLTKIMTNSRARGAWGEVQLRGLVEDVLAPGQYLENVPVEAGSTERVEFAIVMPDASGEEVLMAVDSKFPVETYLRLDDESAGTAFERRVLEEAKRISTKYIKPPHTVDYAVLFLPA